MKDIREMFNISYFDNKELSLKEHCDIYSNIRKDLISILNKYDIKYVVADTESIRDLSKENKSLKKQLEELDKKLFFTKNELEMRQKSIDNKLNQQKEFIEYLEYQVKLQEKLNDIHLATGFEEILSKYKEIIGDDK